MPMLGVQLQYNVKMGKITVLSGFVFPLFIIAVSSKPLETEVSAEDHRWKCIKQCKTASGEMDFDEETLTCKCTIITKVNDAEMAIVEQNAKLLNLDLKPTEDSTKTNFRKRRFISPNHNKKVFSKFEPSDEKEPIVGQAVPVLPKPGPLLPNRPLITQDAALRNLAEIRKKLRDLSNHHARNAAAHAESIRHNLKELSNRVIIAPTSEQRLHRARMNQDRRARERQRNQRINNFRIHGPGGNLIPPRKPIGVLGSSADDDKDVTTISPKRVNRKKSMKTSSNDDDVIVPNSAHHGIIVQPKEFMED